MNRTLLTLAGILIVLVLLTLATGCADHTSPDAPSNADESAAAIETPAASDETSPDRATEPPGIRRAAPDFERTTLSGDTVRLADLRGRVVVLNFWATWCAPCRVEIPHLIDLHREMDTAEVRVLGVSVDKEGEAVIRPYAEEMGITYPLIADPEQTLAETYGGHYAIPTTFIIDPEGQIRQRFMRIVQRDELLAAIEPLLASR